MASAFTAYHGTSVENAAAILRDGLRAWTYFAFKPEHAFLHGGPVVFAVQFSDGSWHGEKDGWQFMTRDHIPPERIRFSEFPAEPDTGEASTGVE